MCTGHTGYLQCFTCEYQESINDTQWIEKCRFPKCTLVVEWKAIPDKCKPFPNKHPSDRCPNPSDRCPNPKGCYKRE